MTTFTRYTKTQAKLWSGRVDDINDPDAARFHQVVKRINLEKLPEAKQFSFCLLGFCCDEGVARNYGRVGAADGPIQIRKELAKLPAHFVGKANILDAGNITCIDGDLSASQLELSRAVELILKRGYYPIVLGGGHEIVYGHYQGVRNYALDQLGHDSPPLMINLDAHFDLRPFENNGTSGTSFNQIAQEHRKNDWPFNYICIGTQTTGNTKSLYKNADALGVKYYDAKDIDPVDPHIVIDEVLEEIKKHEAIYLTLDFDVLNAAYAPGVSSPQPFGLSPELFLKLIKPIIESGKVLSFDIAEVSPRYDDDSQTAKLAAIVIYSLTRIISESL